MRTYRGANSPNVQPALNDDSVILGSAQVGQILKLHAIGNPLPGRQICQIDSRGEIGVLQRRRTDDPAAIGERRRRRILDNHPGGTIGPAPDDGATAGDVAGGDAARRCGPIAVLDDDPERAGRRGRRNERRRAVPQKIASLHSGCQSGFRLRATGFRRRNERSPSGSVRLQPDISLTSPAPKA